jgi:hypothetical protein
MSREREPQGFPCQENPWYVPVTARLRGDSPAMHVSTSRRRLLGPVQAEEVNLVDQLRTSWNPLVSWLRDVQAWMQSTQAVN